MSTRVSAFALAALLAVGAIHCGSAGDSDAGAEDFTASSQVSKSNIVGAVEAIRVEVGDDTFMIGAPKKMTRALKALGIEAQQSLPSKPSAIPTCKASAKIALLGASSEAIASGYFCGADGGQISLTDSPAKRYKLKGLAKLKDIAAEAPLLGDLIYGTVGAEVTNPKENLSASVAEEAAEIIALLDKNAALTPNPMSPKCLPSFSVGLSRSGGEEGAGFRFSCSADATGPGLALFHDPDADKTYGVTIDVGAMREVLEGILESQGSYIVENVDMMGAFEEGRIEGTLEEVDFEDIHDEVVDDYEAFADAYGEPALLYLLATDYGDSGDSIYAFETLRIGASTFGIVSSELGCLASGKVRLGSGGVVSVTYDEEADCGQ